MSLWHYYLFISNFRYCKFRTESWGKIDALPLLVARVNDIICYIWTFFIVYINTSNDAIIIKIIVTSVVINKHYLQLFINYWSLINKKQQIAYDVNNYNNMVTTALVVYCYQ